MYVGVCLCLKSEYKHSQLKWAFSGLMYNSVSTQSKLTDRLTAEPDSGWETCLCSSVSKNRMRGARKKEQESCNKEITGGSFCHLESALLMSNHKLLFLTADFPSHATTGQEQKSIRSKAHFLAMLEALLSVKERGWQSKSYTKALRRAIKGLFLDNLITVILKRIYITVLSKESWDFQLALARLYRIIYGRCHIWLQLNNII